MQPFDFQQIKTLTAAQKATVGALLRGSLSSLAASLTDLMHLPVTIDLHSLDPMPYSRIKRTVQLPCSLSKLRISPRKGIALLVLQTGFALRTIQRLLGGKAVRPQRSHAFTNLDNALIRKFNQVFLKEIESGWRHAYPLAFAIDEQTDDFPNATLIPPGENFLVARFAISLNNENSEILLAIPCKAIADLYESDSPASREKFKLPLNKIDILLKARIGSAEIDAERLATLQPGDVLTLDTPCNAPVDVVTNGRTVLQATPCLTKDKKGIQLL